MAHEGPVFPPIDDFPVKPIRRILDGNEHWSKAFHDDPANKERIGAAAKGQSPQYLWIGCCDSRVPPTTITDTTIGDIFVHRNIANIVRDPEDKYYNDASLWSSVEYSLSHFPISSIIVCGHTDCGGAKAALKDIENDEHVSENLKKYLAPLVELRKQHQSEFKSSDGVTDPKEIAAIERYNAALLAKMNVVNGLKILRRFSIVQEKSATVYGLMFDVATLGLEQVQEMRPL